MEFIVLALLLIVLPLVTVIGFIVSLVKFVKARKTDDPDRQRYKSGTIVLGVLTLLFGTTFVGIGAVLLFLGKAFSSGINHM